MFGSAQRQFHQYFSASAAVWTQRSIEQVDAAPMVLEYLDHNRQAQPGSLANPFRRRANLDAGVGPSRPRNCLAICARVKEGDRQRSRMFVKVPP